MLKIAGATISFDGFDDLDFSKTFTLAPECGYKYIEFNCWYPSNLTRRKTKDLIKRCQDTDLVPIALHIGSFGGFDDDKELTKDVCHKLRAIEMSVEMGCSRVVASGYQRGTRGGLTSVIKSLEHIIPDAEDMNVLMCLENHVDNSIENIGDYEEIFQEIDSPNLGICIDTGHFDAAAVDMNELINKYHSKVNHIHLKENKGFGQKLFTKFGEGTTKNEEVVEKMILHGYEGYLTIELSPEIKSSDGSPFTKDDLIKPRMMFEKFQM